MKIAYVYDNIFPYCVGGVEKRIWELATRLSRRGHDVHLYGMKYWDGKDVINKEGVWLHGVCPPQPLFVNGRRSIKEAMYFAWKVLGPLCKEKFDIIDCQNSPYFPVFSTKVSNLFRQGNLIVTWHEVWDKYWYEYLGKIGICGLIIERLTALLSGRAIAVSESTKNDLQRIGVKGQVAVIPNGVNLKSIENVQSAKESFDVIFAGRLIKEKCVHILIEALSLLYEKKPDIKCLIIGEGPEKEKLKKLVIEKKLQKNISFLGFLKEQNLLFAYVKSSRVFVLPSIREGFGIVVIEANACGIPVITTNHSRNAAKELIVQGENGYLFDMTPHDLAEKILISINRNDWFSICRNQALKYDWDLITRQLETYYLSMCNLQNF